MIRICVPIVNAIEYVVRIFFEVVRTILETICGLVTTIIRTVIEVVKKVCSWLPWPLKKIGVRSFRAIFSIKGDGGIYQNRCFICYSGFIIILRIVFIIFFPVIFLLYKHRHPKFKKKHIIKIRFSRPVFVFNQRLALVRLRFAIGIYCLGEH